VVFPLGMYSVATLTFGKVARIGFMEPLAHVVLWIAVAAWVVVAAAMAWSFIRQGHRTAN
jgi:tellurite resistance protein TehA-like permease